MFGTTTHLIFHQNYHFYATILPLGNLELKKRCLGLQATTARLLGCPGGYVQQAQPQTWGRACHRNWRPYPLKYPSSLAAFTWRSIHCFLFSVLTLPRGINIIYQQNCGIKIFFMKNNVCGDHKQRPETARLLPREFKNVCWRQLACATSHPPLFGKKQKAAEKEFAAGIISHSSACLKVAPRHLVKKCGIENGGRVASSGI